MGAAIFYFTGTGNSLAVARRLADLLDGPDPSPMARHLGDGEVASGSDVVGLVYPVHHWGPADLVLRFARLLRPPEGSYVFAVATYGNHSGRAFQDLDRALRVRGHGLDAGFHVRTVQNYVPVFMVPDEEERCDILSFAGMTVDDVGQSIAKRGKGEREHWWWRPKVRAYYLSSKAGLHEKDRHFIAKDGCDSCGVCMRVCPVRNIAMEGGRPAWQRRCEQCFACIHWCPRGAIEWGGATQGMGRYHHPDVTVEDMEAQAVKGSPSARRM